MTAFHPGTSEVGWLADLKEISEQVGKQVFGESIRWDVEVVKKTGLKRPDVVIRRDRDGVILASGEAKRPDDTLGIHPLVMSEVRNALGKATQLGAPVCFTTNFFEAAVFRASGTAGSELERMQGSLIKLVPDSLAKAPHWWDVLPMADRSSSVLLGLKQLFERIKAAQTTHVPRDINEVTLLVFSRVTDRLLQPLYEVLLSVRNGGKLTPAMKAHALRVHLLTEADDQLRFLVAQGIAEVLTAILFYRNIVDHFSLGPLLAGTNPKTATAFLARIKRSLESAMKASGDYETILELSPIAEFVLENGGDPALEHWRQLVSFVDQLDFTTVTTDVIGTIFERLISPERRHAMGQHYTNTRLARSMSKWAMRDPEHHFADVSCGAGTFLVELHRLMLDAGRTHSQALAQLFGNDVDPFAVHLASINLVTRDIYRGANYPATRLGDAFEIQPGATVVDVEPQGGGGRINISWPKVGLDGVVGNPPYADKPDDVGKLQGQLASLGLTLPSGMVGGNLAAWFFLLSRALVKKTGVIALVMPSGVLQNSNLDVWRAWLRKNFDTVVWHCEDDVWFSDARVATCVILARPREKSDSFGSLHFVDIRDRVEGDLVQVNGAPSPVPNAAVRDISPMEPAGDILVEGTYPAVLREFASHPNVQTLGGSQDVTVYSGNKLGHEFFQLKDLAPAKKTVLRRVSGLKMEFDLSRTYLTPLLSSPKDERTGEFVQSDVWVLKAPEKLPSSGQLRDYIDRAKKLGVHKKASVAQRGSSWWNVNWREAQVAIQIHPSMLHQVWWGEEPFVAKNNFHTLAFAGTVAQSDRELIAASLASGWGALCALFVSSEVGCEGVRWLSTSQLNQWPTLIPNQITRTDRAEVLKAYRLFRKLEAKEIPAMDDAATHAWLVLTEAVARAAGINKPREAAESCIALARETCERRTRRETIALAGRFRKGGSTGRTLAKHVHERLELNPDAAEAVADLTAGERALKLRSEEQLAQGSLFGDDDGSVAGEAALARVLGAGFECAPVSKPEEPEYLARRIEAMLHEVIDSLVGQRPPDDDPAVNTYDETAADVSKAAIGWFRHEVEKRLT